jgi:hypothetical protein
MVSAAALPPGQRFAGGKFARGEVIAILTFVAYAQLLT